MSIFYSCKKATELIERKQLGRISFVQNIRLSVHTSMCKICNSYQKQSKKLHFMLNKYLKQHEKTQSSTEQEELNTKILDRINSEPD